MILSGTAVNYSPGLSQEGNDLSRLIASDAIASTVRSIVYKSESRGVEQFSSPILLEYGSEHASLVKTARAELCCGNLSNSIEIYKRILLLKPDVWVVSCMWLELGIAYAKYLMPENAKTCFEESLKQHSGFDAFDEALVKLHCAVAYFLKFRSVGDSDSAASARKYIDECTELVPNLAATIVMRSALLQLQGETTRAENSIKKAKTLWPYIAITRFGFSS